MIPPPLSVRVHQYVAMGDAYVWLLPDGTWPLLDHVARLIFGRINTSPCGSSGVSAFQLMGNNDIKASPFFRQIHNDFKVYKLSS